MLEEGVTREVINRVEKPRKSAELNVDEKMTYVLHRQPQGTPLSQDHHKVLDYIQT